MMAALHPRSALTHARWGLFGIILGLGVLAGCSGFSSDDQPLPDSTFTRVLTELHLATARKTAEVPYPSSLRDSIFARYDVQPTEFDATMEFYSRHPEAFESLYQSVIDTLRTLRYPTRRGPQGVPDSLRNDNDQESASK